MSAVSTDSRRSHSARWGTTSLSRNSQRERLEAELVLGEGQVHGGLLGIGSVDVQRVSELGVALAEEGRGALELVLALVEHGLGEAFDDLAGPLVGVQAGSDDELGEPRGSGPRARIVAATSRALAMSSSGSVTAVTSPIRSASAASTIRPVRMSSIARPVPSSRPSRWEPPAPAGQPRRSREAESRRLRGDPDIARHRDLTAAAEREAVDRRDGGFGKSSTRSKSRCRSESSAVSFV